MVKTKEIKIFFLSIVYLVLMLSVVIPHHHHEELTCFTTSHCENDVDTHQGDADKIDDHHHDQNSTDESVHCLSIDDHIVTVSGKSIRQVSLPIALEHGHDFIFACNACVEDGTGLENNCKLINLLPLTNIYTAFVKHILPLRAPPAFLV